jgi:hypothetical protein
MFLSLDNLTDANMQQSREGLSPTCYAMAHARTSLDARDESQEGQHGTLPQTSVGLERLDLSVCLYLDSMRKRCRRANFYGSAPRVVCWTWTEGW